MGQVAHQVVQERIIHCWEGFGNLLNIASEFIKPKGVNRINVPQEALVPSQHVCFELLMMIFEKVVDSIQLRRDVE